SGLSRPSWERRSATACGVAFVPSMAAAGSPGSTRMSTNTSTSAPTLVGTRCARRCAMRFTLSVGEPRKVEAPPGFQPAHAFERADVYGAVGDHRQRDLQHVLDDLLLQLGVQLLALLRIQLLARRGQVGLEIGVADVNRATTLGAEHVRQDDVGVRLAHAAVH